MSEYITDAFDTYFNRGSFEIHNIINIEIQKMIQEYSVDNNLLDLKCNHIFELPRIIRYYDQNYIVEADNYRKSYIIMDFYCYDYKTQQVYKGKKINGNVVLKINPLGIKITNNYIFKDFL